MLIVQNRKIRKERKDRKAKAKARRRAMRTVQLVLLVLIAGLFGFFAYNNVDYFLTVIDGVRGEKTVAKKDKSRGSGKRSTAVTVATDTAVRQQEHLNVDEILGEPVFSSGDFSLLTHMTAVLRQMDTAQEPVRIVRMFEGSEFEAEEDEDEGEVILETYEVKNNIVGEPVDFIYADTISLASIGATVDTDIYADVAVYEKINIDVDDGIGVGVDIHAIGRAANEFVSSIVNRVVSVVASAIAEIAAITADIAVYTGAATDDIVSHTPTPAPMPTVFAASAAAYVDIDTVHDLSAVFEPPKPVAAGTFVLSDISCKLADRDDIFIRLSVELIYDCDALRDEVNFKRGALTAVVGNVIRKYEYGNVVLSSLRTDLLNSFNRVLKEGSLTDINIQNFRVEQVALR